MATHPKEAAQDFCVECSNNPHALESAVTRYFPTLDDAFEYIDTCRLKAIWLSERGTNIEKTKGGDWYWFWWNDLVAKEGQWNAPDCRGRGYPSQSPQYMVDYVPVSASK